MCFWFALFDFVCFEKITHSHDSKSKRCKKINLPVIQFLVSFSIVNQFYQLVGLTELFLFVYKQMLYTTLLYFNSIS